MNEEQLVEEFSKRSITLASLQKRAVAFLVDEIIISFFLIFAFSDVFKDVTSSGGFVDMSILVPYAAAMKLIYQAFFVYMYGATPGKMLLKIKIIFTYSIDKPNFTFSFLRSVGRLFSESFFYIGFAWAFFNPKRQTWQDLVAKTLVVNA